MRVPLTTYRRLLVTYLGPQRSRVLALAALLLGTIGLQLLNPQILRFFIDTARAGGSSRTLTLAALAFFGIALLTQAVSIAATYLSEQIGWSATNALRSDLTLHCLKLDLPFHHQHTPGALIERIDGDVNALANFFSQFVVRVLGSMLLLGGVLIVLWWEDWRVGGLLTAFVVISLLLLSRVRDVAVPHWAAARQISADLFGFLEERLSGTEDLRSSGAEAHTLRRLAEWMRRVLLTERSARLMGMTLWSVTTALFVAGNALAFLISAYLFNLNAITLGTVYLVFYYTELLRQPLDQLIDQFEDLQRASASIGRIQELCELRSAVVDGPGAQLPGGALSVEFADVTFGYSQDAPILRDLSLFVAPGHVLGLLGRTGSGKTTITRLLSRLYDPDGGAIRLGGVDLRDTRLEHLRQRVGVVTQQVDLFQANVRDNLTFFDQRIPDERIAAVLELLGLGEWQRGLSHGLDTPLSADGAGLSAGEAQLLAFARVFLLDPGLVILDEASSRLDPATERLIERAVDLLLRPEDGRRRTAIIVAHRLETIQRADEIAILEAGRVCEYGSRSQLARDRDSRFARLLQTGLEEVLA
ncbi:MAG TPA: ABC transporter ATP-binding protein [Herpetosiphonaceae bacterium]